MKKHVLTVVLILLATQVAKAEPLPEQYIGSWCVNESNWLEGVDGEDWAQCRDGLKITRKGWSPKTLYSADEITCEFTAIKTIRETLPKDSVLREIYKSSWRLVLRVSSRCSYDDTFWTQVDDWKWGRASEAWHIVPVAESRPKGI